MESSNTKSNKGIEFKKYQDIENLSHRSIQKLMGVHSTTEPWIAMEKVHGTNFCFVYNGVELKCAKRTSFLEKDDKFYNYNVIVEKHGPKIKQIFEELKKKHPTLQVVRVFGEFYGGKYP